MNFTGSQHRCAKSMRVDAQPLVRETITAAHTMVIERVNATVNLHYCAGESPGGISDNHARCAEFLSKLGDLERIRRSFAYLFIDIENSAYVQRGTTAPC